MNTGAWVAILGLEAFRLALKMSIKAEENGKLGTRQDRRQRRQRRRARRDRIMRMYHQLHKMELLDQGDVEAYLRHQMMFGD